MQPLTSSELSTKASTQARNKDVGTVGENGGAWAVAKLPESGQLTPRAGQIAREDLDARNAAAAQRGRARMESSDWTPTYSPWRHGGSYVDNIVYPSGAVGCISSAAHTISKKFESACFDLGKFKTRDAAAAAERAHAIELWARADADAALAENSGETT